MLVSFQAATTSAPGERGTTAIRVRPAQTGEEVLEPAGGGEPGQTARLVEAVRGALRLTRGPPARGAVAGAAA